MSPRLHRALIWLLLVAVTATDTALLALAAEAYGRTALWWLVQKASADPLIAWLAIDTLVLRLALFLLGIEIAAARGSVRVASWLLFVPLLGAPMLVAALLVAGDERRARS